MIISTRGRYALRILIDLAEHQTDGYTTLKQIAERQRLSEKYLESIVKELVRAKFVEGLRGKGGGYRLSRPAAEINVRDVLHRMEGTLAPVACLEEGSKPCPHRSDCRTIPLWEGLDKVVCEYLSGFTVQDLARQESEGSDAV